MVMKMTMILWRWYDGDDDDDDYEEEEWGRRGRRRKKTMTTMLRKRMVLAQLTAGFSCWDVDFNEWKKRAGSNSNTQEEAQEIKYKYKYGCKYKYNCRIKFKYTGRNARDQIQIQIQYNMSANTNMNQWKLKHFLLAILGIGSWTYLIVPDLNDAFVCCFFVRKWVYGGGSRTINSNVEAFSTSFFSSPNVDKKVEGISRRNQNQNGEKARANNQCWQNLIDLTTFSLEPEVVGKKTRERMKRVWEEHILGEWKGVAGQREKECMYPEIRPCQPSRKIGHSLRSIN